MRTYKHEVTFHELIIWLIVSLIILIMIMATGALVRKSNERMDRFNQAYSEALRD